ncbi:amidase 1-like [Neltuma alba]|uniref:amidase 1-like n=1 Tax=Neltuma alba TaxID=207710 RepID=UPI0010A57C6D|nr:amidase 1-like [Prosopis alba]
MATVSDYGAFMQKFILLPSSSSHGLPLSSLTFAVKEIFDVEGHVTGFGHPDWARTHPVASSTSPAVSALLNAGATCVGTTVMDEMAYSINGENIHYGTPRNPCAADRVPGGSSSGSAVAVGAKLVDFSLGTDTGGSVRVPSSYCGIFGFRPSHGTVSTSGVIPLAQSFDTVGWFARNPVILSRVGRVLLQLPEAASVRPTHIIIADDCLQPSSIPHNLVAQILIKAVEKLYGDEILKHEMLGDFVKDRVPTLRHFMMGNSQSDQVYNIPSLAALSTAMRLLERYEFKINHGEWVRTVKPELGPEISERVSEALRATGENIDLCRSVKEEMREALSALLGDFGVLVIPTVPGPPPKIGTNTPELETFRAKAFALLSIAGVSGCCQVNVPMGMHEGLPISISLVARQGADGFLLHLVERLYDLLQQEITPSSQ